MIHCAWMLFFLKGLRATRAAASYCCAEKCSMCSRCALQQENATGEIADGFSRSNNKRVNRLRTVPPKDENRIMLLM